MFKEAVGILQDYGWVALFLFASGTILLRYLSNRLSVWNQRDRDRVASKENKVIDQLANHQLFANIDYKINSEIPTISFGASGCPVRQRMFRRLLEIKTVGLKQLALKIISTDKIKNMSATEWASFVQQELLAADRAVEEAALKDGIPPLVVNKFMVWRHHTQELLHNYVNDLAMSTVYTTNVARTNTLLYLLNLKLITDIGDGERTFININGEITGQMYKGSIIE